MMRAAIHRLLIPVPFNPAQKHLYDIMRRDAARRAERVLGHKMQNALRVLSSDVIRLIKVVSNPSLLLCDSDFLYDDLLAEVIAEGPAPKLRIACERARRLAKKGQKSIIWTTYRQNVESMAGQLRDLRAVYIHGGIDTGVEKEHTTKEGRFGLFRNDPDCLVMVASPAAAGDGVSLYESCRHAIYVDRTYNAAHYFHSQNRIRPLGLASHEFSTIEILFCPGSIDESVQERLEAKVNMMVTALNDQAPSVRASQSVSFSLDNDPKGEFDVLDEEDVRSLLDE